MPPKPLPKRALSEMRRRFRELIDWAFDGNLSMASRHLQMPFSTVQQYYDKGPRRFQARAIERITELLGCDIGGWLQVQGYVGRTTLLDVTGGTMLLAAKGRVYFIPNAVMWRVSRILHCMKDRSTADWPSVKETFFGHITKAMNIGLIEGDDESDFQHSTHFVSGSSPSAFEHDEGALVAADATSTGTTLERAKRVHKLCAYWEDELDL